MKATVIVCTYNRAGSLLHVLREIAAQTFPNPMDWEVLVVDNNSKDNTRDVAERFCLESPGRFRYIFEPRQGKSNALNAGVREARGEILAFVDDDVTVTEDWLASLMAAFGDGEWAGAGGRVRLQWNCPPPRWLPLQRPWSLAGVLAGWDQGEEPRQLLDELPIGANMAFRREAFEKYGGFRTDLGPNPVNLMRSEDLEFGRRLIAAGERLRYAPDAIVYHPVTDERLTRKYFLAWYFDFGRAIAREFKETDGHCWRGVPRYQFRNLGKRAWQWMVEPRPAMRFFRKAMVWQKAGEIAERYGQAHSAKNRLERAATLELKGGENADHSHSMHV
jgi:glycosyltransferase involved in cell wall biosynthesis